jgi:hypothetical protein
MKTLAHALAVLFVLLTRPKVWPILRKWKRIEAEREGMRRRREAERMDRITNPAKYQIVPEHN